MAASCPTCKKPFDRRKNGGCPHCGQALEAHGGYYYRADLGSPTLAFLAKFETYVSEQTSKKQQMVVVFHISKKTAQYKRELAEAQRLLDLCEGDFDLAAATLDVLFRNPQFAFKSRASLLSVHRDFMLAQAIAIGLLKKLDKQEARQLSAFEQVMNKEDIWA